MKKQPSSPATTVPDALVSRPGEAPRTYRGLPHTQLDQQPDAPIRAQLSRRFDDLPGAEERPSTIAVPGTRALCLRPDVPGGPPEAFLAGREFAHLHPHPDSSLHLVLSEAVAGAVLDAGWGELHPLAGRDGVPPTALLVYAPRTTEEIDIVLGLVQRSYEYVTTTT